jgi:hypothetical protein
MGVGGQRQAPAALPPGKTLYSLYRRLCGPQDRSGRVWKISPPPGFDTQTVQHIIFSSTHELTFTQVKPNYRINKGQPRVPILSQINLVLPPRPPNSLFIINLDVHFPLHKILIFCCMDHHTRATVTYWICNFIFGAYRHVCLDQTFTLKRFIFYVTCHYFCASFR